MSREPRPASAPRSSSQQHRRRASSIDSYYTCGTSSHQLGRTRSPPHSVFQPPPSSYPPPHILSNVQNNSSQSSLGHSSSYHSTSSARYPEPYTSDPFLPLKELRRLRSNEQLSKPSSIQSLATATLPRATRKTPPTLTLNGLDSNFNIPFPAVADRRFETQQGRDPVVEPCTAARPATELFAESPAASQSSRTGLGTSKSDLASASTSYIFPPIALCPATPDPADPQSNEMKSERTTSVAERHGGADIPDVSPALQFMFGVGIPVNEVESCRVNISQSPARNEATVCLWDSQEQRVAYGGMKEPDGVGKTELDSTQSQIRSDLDRTPTNELASMPWPSVSAPSPSLQRKRPAPIYVGNQVQRSTVTQTEIAAAARSNGENVMLKTHLRTSINDDARSRKESEASQFSLSMFPATPTTPVHAVVLRAALNSAQSPLHQSFFSKRQSLGASPACLAPPLTAQSLHFPRSAPTTPIRRETIELNQHPSTSYTRKRTEHARVDSPAHQRERSRAVSIATRTRCSHVFSPEPIQPLLEVTAAQPLYGSLCEAPFERHRARSHSFGSHSAYSQDPPLPQRQNSDSCSCNSDDEDDDAVSMTSSVAEAIMMAQRERRWSRQSRLAYMRDSFATGTGREPSIESHLSSASSSGSADRSGIPGTPDYEEGYLEEEEEKMAVPAVKYARRDALVPTVNVIPPTRKPVPRLSTVIEPTPYNPPSSGPGIELRPLRSASSMQSLRFNAEPPGRVMVSHPHLRRDEPFGLEALPHGGSRTTLTTDGGVGVHSLAHSKSMSALRPPSSGGRNVVEKKPKVLKSPFDKYGMPTNEQLRLASDMYVFDEFGDAVRFGDIFEGQKTAVCFIRHFWCPLCQDYMSSIVHLTEPALVEKAGVKLVIIGNGSPSMIKGYREDIFQCPYEMYTDPSRQLYKVLGMHLRTNDGGSEEEKGSYVKHGTFTGTLMVLKNALKMPLANAGDIKQLGGEFVLGPGLTCSFTSRMHTTRSHTPIRDLLEAAGVDTKPWVTDLSFIKSDADQARWMDVQNEDLDRLIRRGLQQATSTCNLQLCTLDEDVTGSGELDLGEFRRLMERLKRQVGDQAPTPTPPVPTAPTALAPNPRLEHSVPPAPSPVHSAPVTGPSYEIEVKGQKRVELDHLGAVLQSRNESSTWESRRIRKQSGSRPGTAGSRPGTANSRPGTAKSVASQSTY